METEITKVRGLRYEDAAKILHLCKGSQLVSTDSATYVVWTLCGIDVPANESFLSDEVISCKFCLQEQNRIKRNHGQFGVGA